jgi:hypothetical protein
VLLSFFFWFVVPWNPWFLRGAYFSLGTESGMFAISNTYGMSSDNCSFRRFIMIKETLVNLKNEKDIIINLPKIFVYFSVCLFC